VAAENIIGWSSESSENTVTIALVATAPLTPAASPTRDATSSHLQLVVNWADLTGTDTGGVAITSYHLQYDGSSGGVTWTNLIGHDADSTALTYTVTSNI
jgi:hypothetical protein